VTLDEEIRERLIAADLKGMFLEVLGWDQPGLSRFDVDVDGAVFEIIPVAQKRGLHVLAVGETEVPTADVQHRVDMRVAARAAERLLIFTDDERQVWRWPEPRKSGGVKLVPQVSSRKAPAPSLIQRLAGIKFTYAEEEALTLPQVKGRVRTQFNVEAVTARFYERFETQHSNLQDGLEGISDAELRRWYASLLMNRLMFIYFLQRKGFVNNDRDFLRTCLRRIRELRGPDEFYGFYRDALLPMFHHGFGSHKHKYPDPEVAELLGDVPYVDGGIFEEHPIEAEHVIRVPDEEFEAIFDFFDSFSWHLDDRPHGDPDTINPDVIGYIFERYINLTASGKKKEGAYYTKEDVTGYMVETSLIPRLLDRLIAHCGVNPFVLLQAAPKRYVPEALRHGEGPDRWLPLPAGADAWGDVARWSELEALPREEGLQLPGESWIETLDRRARVDELLADIGAGEINTVDELVSRNLDSRTLLADVVHALDSPQEVADAWDEVSRTTVIDPTCGSGAFLFAALDVLDDVYAALLERARTHLATGEEHAAELLGPIVSDVDRHANDGYYRRKRAALRNLFGLDIMKEAVETAKLRLFLALASELEQRNELEALPDLDFNLRAGNLLAGFLDADDARSRVGTTTIEALAAVDEFVPKAQQVEELRAAFISAQAGGDPDEILMRKRKLATAYEELRDDANAAYAAAEGIGRNQLAEWLAQTQPFHWLLEFPEIIEQGGFDVVVGNPPYVNRKHIDYDIKGFRTAELSDIYAPCVERSLDLVGAEGRFAMILPIAFQFSDRHRAAREVVLEQGTVWVSTYSRNPSALFTAGLGVRNAITITAPQSHGVRTTETRRWQKEARESLFPTTRYTELQGSARKDAWLPRTGDPDVAQILFALKDRETTLGRSIVTNGAFPLGFKTTALYYLPVYTSVPPVYNSERDVVDPPTDGSVGFATEDDRLLALALLAGELALLWWMSTGDDFHITVQMLKRFPIGLASIDSRREVILALGKELEDELHQPDNLLFTPYKGLMTGSWDLRRVRRRTREIDRLVLDALGLSDALPAVLRAVARFHKSTGERPGTQRGMSWLEERSAAA